MTVRLTPNAWRVGVHGDRFVFRTDLDSLALWLRQLDQWIAHANSVAKE
jgi:hypothetical protein